jgi:hypothetical protein
MAKAQQKGNKVKHVTVTETAQKLLAKKHH